MTTKALFWDNDGVLVDTERLYLVATQQVLASVGVALTEEQYVEYFLVHGSGAWHLAAERGIAPGAIDRLRHERDALYGAMLERDVRVLDGVREVLSALHGTYTMGIVTSSERRHFETIHRKTGILQYFGFVLAAGDYPRSKPHPDPYLRAVELSGFRAEECLAVEDSERGLAAATAAGVPCVVVPSDLTRGGEFASAHRVLQRLPDLLTLLSNGDAARA